MFNGESKCKLQNMVNLVTSTFRLTNCKGYSCNGIQR